MTETIWGRIAKLETPAKHYLTALASEIERSLFFHNAILPAHLRGKKDSEQDYEPCNFDDDSRYGRTAESIQKELEPPEVPEETIDPREFRIRMYENAVAEGREIEFIPANVQVG